MPDGAYAASSVNRLKSCLSMIIAGISAEPTC